MHVTESDHASINFDCHRTFRSAAISNLTVPGHSATATSQPSLGLQQGFKVVLQGLVIEVVDQCTSRSLQADEKHHNVDMASGAGMFAWHHESMQIAQSPRRDLASGLPEDDAFWKTLIVDRILWVVQRRSHLMMSTLKYSIIYNYSNIRIMTP